MGMWRHVVGGKTKLFEFVSIRQEESGPELTLRHFEPDFVNREEKDKPFRAKLIRHAPGEAVFEDSSARGSCA